MKALTSSIWVWGAVQPAKAAHGIITLSQLGTESVGQETLILHINSDI